MPGEEITTIPTPYDEESHSAKLFRKMKEAPFVPIGIGGMVGAVTYGILHYRKRGQMATSVYIMQFRVIAQGMVVGAIMIGLGVNIFSRLWDRQLTKSTGNSGGSSSD